MTIPAPSPPAPDPLGWLNNQPYLLLSLTSLFWAGNIVLGRYVAGHVPPMTLSCLMDRRGPHSMAGPAAPSEPRLGSPARAAAADGAVVRDRIPPQKTPPPLAAAANAGAERAV